jgi:hypothetical protein
MGRNTAPVERPMILVVEGLRSKTMGIPTVAEKPANLIDQAAHKLAVDSTDESDLPARYRNLTNASRKIRKVNDDSDIEKRFKANVDSWRQLISTMLAKLEPSQAWRFINRGPQVDGVIHRVTDNKDFCDFVDYMIQRRDAEKCTADELGGLALLVTAFQREVAKQIQP